MHLLDFLVQLPPMQYIYLLVLTLTLLCLPQLLNAQLANDECGGAIDLPAFPRVQTCPADNGVSFAVAAVGTTIGGTPSAPSIPCVPADGGPPVANAADSWYRFVSSGNINDVRIATDQFNRMQLRVFEGSECSNIQAESCIVGSNVIETTIFANPGDTVYIQISGLTPDGSNQGQFAIDITSRTICQACLQNNDANIRLNPRNEGAIYACGSTVNVCFTLNRYDGNDAGSVEWLHSIVPTFGPGWDTTSIVPTTFPPSCDGSGTWMWYPDGWTSCATGRTFPRGFAYETNAGYNAACGSSPSTPGNNFGDGMGPCVRRTTPVTWCFDVNVTACPPDGDTFDGEDLDINVAVYSDGAAGSWTNEICADDEVEFTSIGTVIICVDEDPIVTTVDQFCPGVPDGSATISPNGGSDNTTPFNITVRDEDGDAVYQCMSCLGTQNVSGLLPGTYTAEAVNVTNACPRNVTFIIEEGETPTATFTFNDVCPGDGPITLTGSVNGMGTSLEYEWTDPNGMVTTIAGDPVFMTADPAVIGTYTLVAYVDGCPSDTARRNIDYLPEVTLTALDTMVCPNTPVAVQLSVTNGGGPYVWRLDGTRIDGQTGPTLFQRSPVEPGFYTYSVDVVGGPCPQTLSQVIEVLGPLPVTVVYDPDSVICVNEELTLRVFQEDGSPFPPFGYQFSWMGSTPSATRTSFQVFNTSAPVENQIVVLSIRAPTSCITRVEIPYTIAEDPVAELDVTSANICNDEDVEICVTHSAGLAPYRYNWNTGVAADTNQCLTINAVSPVTTGLFAEVTDAAGCMTQTDMATVNIAPALGAVVIPECVELNDVTRVAFSWNDVGQTGFQTTYSVNGGAAITDNNYAATTLEVTGLNPGDLVTLTVTPVFNLNGTICVGDPSNTRTCEALNCFSPNWQFTQPAPVCLTTDPQPYDFTISAARAGEIFITSTDLGITDLAADASNTTTLQLPALPAGQRTGSYSITAGHESFDGICTFDTTVVIDVVAPPVQAVDVADAQICQNGTTTFTYAGDAMGLTFNWSLPTGATLQSGDISSAGPITVAFAETGTQTVTVDIIDPVCGTLPATGDVEVVAPLTPPVVTCGPAGVLSVNFVWDAQPDATGYRVSIDGGAPFEQTETNYGLSMLTEGQVVTIQVTALGVGVCGDSQPSLVTSCTAELCPNFTTNFGGVVDSICILDGDETIDLSVITVEGGSGVNATLTFSGMGVSGTTLDAASLPNDETGEMYTVYIDYAEEGPCTYRDSLLVTVFARPSVFIIPPMADVCLGDTIEITVGSTEFVSAPDIQFMFGDAEMVDDGNPDDNRYSVRYTTPGVKQISANITRPSSGCQSLDAVANYTVFEPLATPVLTCGPNDLEEATFDWGEVAGAEGYLVESSEGTTQTLPFGTTSFTVTGLVPDQQVTLTVTALSSGPCGNGASASLTCNAAPCPGSTVSILTPAQRQCLDGTETTITLTAELEGGATPQGPFNWSGPGVTDDGTTVTWDPTGLPAGDYEVVVMYDGPNFCDTEDRVTFSLRDLPPAAIMAAGNMVCAGAPLAIGFDGPPPAGNTLILTWDWDGGVANNVGGEQYEVTWATPGNKVITLTTNDGCTNQATFNVTVTPTLDAPQPTCTEQRLDGVTFSWPAITGAEGYQVSVNGGPFLPTQTVTEYVVDGLAFGESVTIAVRAVRTGTTCDESPATEATCAARECPPITFAPAASQTEFCADETTPAILNANLTGDDSTGDLSWSGPGVIDDGAGNFTFDPTVAGIGVHTLIVTYVQESLCTYSDDLVMTVNALPDTNFTVSATTICAGSELVVIIDSPADNYSVTTPGVTFTESADAPGTFTANIAGAGNYEITLRQTTLSCTARAVQTVSVEATPNAGTPLSSPFERCAAAIEPAQLATRLTGADAGGTWAANDAALVTNLNPATGELALTGLSAGTYDFTYAVGGTVCPADVATVTLNLVAAPRADAGDDQFLTCRMGMVTIGGMDNSEGPGVTYQWMGIDSNMVTDADMQLTEVSQPGRYVFSVTDATGCMAFDTVRVIADQEAPVLEVNVSNISCFRADDGAIAVTGVNGGRSPYTYRLNGEPRGAATLFSGLTPQRYDLEVTDANGCFSNLSLDLTEPDELTVQLRFPGDSAETAFGTEVFITAQVNGGNAIDTLIWQPDSLSTNGEGRDGIRFVAQNTRMVSVTVVDSLGCTATDRQMLLVRKERPVYIPNAFSPNGDSNNDILFVNADPDIITSLEDFNIYDRWGELMFSSNDMEGTDAGRFPPNVAAFGWNGTHNGQLMNPQVFIVTVKANFADGSSEVYKSDFVLMR